MSINPGDLRFVKRGERPRARDQNALVRAVRNLSQFGGDAQCLVTSNGRFCRRPRSLQNFFEGILVEDLDVAPTDLAVRYGITSAVSASADIGDAFIVLGDATRRLSPGVQFHVHGSDNNDGVYTIRSGSAFGMMGASAGKTTINIEESPDDSAGEFGNVILDNSVNNIFNVTTGAAGSASFDVLGDVAGILIAGEAITVVGSTGNDGGYTLSGGFMFNGTSTSVPVSQAINDSTADGYFRIAPFTTAKLSLFSDGGFTFGDTAVTITITNRSDDLEAEAGTYAIGTALANGENRLLWVDCSNVVLTE